MSNQNKDQHKGGQSDKHSKQNPGQQNAGQQNANQENTGRENAGQQNEGEGNRTAARAYNADQHHFVENPQKVKDAAQSAKKAVEGKEGASLERAEKEGMKHAKH
jgi:hypothetical protein